MSLRRLAAQLFLESAGLAVRGELDPMGPVQDGIEADG
jgi:hypothetical protein